MIKILIENRLYNIKDGDFEKLREANYYKDNQRINDVLKNIETSYSNKGWIDSYSYKK